MKKRLIGQVGASALVLSTLFGVAPVAADEMVLPPTANGTDNSGITALLCDSNFHFRLPMTPAASPAYADQAMYPYFMWSASVGGQELAGSPNENFSWADDVLVGGEIDPALTSGGSVTFTLEADSRTGAKQSFELTVNKTTPSFAGGTGTKADPYLIANAQDLNEMRCVQDKYFKLTKDIDLAGFDWMPIGNFEYGWRGAFDGAGFTIKNLTLEGLFEGAGLFSFAEQHSIRNLTLKNFDISGDEKVGTLAGRLNRGAVHNITVVDSKVKGRTSTGLLVGNTEFAHQVNKVSVQGEVHTAGRIEGAPEQLSLAFPSRVGGVVGHEAGDGNIWTNITADVDVKVLDIENRLEGQVFRNDTQYFVTNIGGFGGYGDDAGTFNKIKVTSTIELPDDPEFPSFVMRVGGFLSQSDSGFAKNLDLNTTITDKGYGQMEDVGGIIGAIKHFDISRVKSVSKIDIEAGFSDDTGRTLEIGGGFGDTYYEDNFQDIQSKTDINIVRLGGVVTRVGGFIGYEDEATVIAVDSQANIKVADANGSNNTVSADLDTPAEPVERIGGFAGEHSNYFSHTGVSSRANVEIVGAPAMAIGGFMGAATDREGLSLRNAVSSGTVTVPAGSSKIASFIGNSGPLRLSNVLVSTSLNVNGSTEDIGVLYGGVTEFAIQHSRFYDSFVDANLSLPAERDGVPSLFESGKKIRSAKFLRANGFDLVNVFRHVEGKLPVIRFNVPEFDDAEIEKGRTNQDTSISVSVKRKNGVRSYFVNMPNVNARQVASLFVVRNGVKVKLINVATLNRVGNWYAESKFTLRQGDVLRVEIGGKKQRTLSL